MSPAERTRTSMRPLDPAALARVVRRLHAAPQPPWLHGEAARRMAERLPVIRLQPDTVIDWAPVTGASHEVLGRAYPKARVLPVMPTGVGPAPTAASPAAPWWSPRRWRGAGAGSDAPVAEADVAPGSAQLLWSNMALHGAADPQAVMDRWHRAIATDGFLMFSTLGPGSLASLRALYAAQGWPPPHAPFVDMHDLGDMLVAAGFADPVMDQETVTLTWPTPQALLDELRTLGGNVDPGRPAGLRTPRWQRRLLELLAEGADAQGRLGLQFELVYGHAFRPPPRPRVAARTEVAVEDLRAMARAGRRP